MLMEPVHPRGPDPLIHPAWCDCSDCQQTDVVGYARSRLALRIWAAIFITLLVLLYGSVLWLAPEILAAFGWAG